MVGNVDAEGQKLVKCAFDCLAGAFASIKPGKTMYQDVGKVISKVRVYVCMIYIYVYMCG
jgi:methionine aminopeptidase